jgi:uncharacterized membrane protein SirB2
MSMSNHIQKEKAAMKFALTLAGIIYLIAISFSVFSENWFLFKLLLIAVVICTSIILYALKKA